ncbi:MAG: DAK2 domain-containing protein [Chloroflexi bacterium]|nr:DAK2 domain-containing protein [Chloroflexota bacterium]
MNKPEIISETQTDKPVIESINGETFNSWVNAALIWLKTNQQTVNSLNVFPVPDGDTGTNMVLTMQSAINETKNTVEKNIGKIAHSFAQGALMGARGNSGVILSQIWRGFARALDSYETMDAQLLAHALAEARDTAYKGVVRPVEGTILTVSKDIAAAAENSINETSDLMTILENVVQAADESVKRTPELLPILKQAGVVDSGGKGLFYLMDGALRFVRNESLETPLPETKSSVILKEFDQHLEIEPGQDFEVVVDFKPGSQFNLNQFHQRLSDIGSSIQIAEGDDYYRMHIHVPTENRYLPIDYIMSVGQVTKVAIENLLEQMEQQKNNKSELEFVPVEPGQIACIAVSPSDGISKIFASLGVAAIVGGGQTMNPSIEEIVNSFKDLPTDKIIILPNNKNIVFAANAAVEATNKKVAVVPSVSIPQGLSAILQLLPDGDFDTVVKHMKEALKEPQTGEITIATRDVKINGVSVKSGEVIVLLDGKLIAATDSLIDACIQLLKKADTKERERITLFYGNNLTLTEVNPIVEEIQKRYPTHEIEVLEGGQPHYHFIIAIE